MSQDKKTIEKKQIKIYMKCPLSKNKSTILSGLSAYSRFYTEIPISNKKFLIKISFI